MTVSRELPSARLRDWIGLAVLALPCVLYAMDLTVLNLAVPALSRDLNPSSSQLLWIVDIYGFIIAGSLITMGTLGDRIGRRRLLLIGAAAFGLSSVVAAFSTSTPMLIATRAVMGVAGATLAPSTLSLVRSMFLNSRERTLAISIWITSYSVGGAIGPLIGGIVLEHFWWGSVFLIGVPVMVLLLIVGPMLLPEFRDPQAGKLDVLSAALSLAAILPTIYMIKSVAEHGPDASEGLSLVLGLLAGALFVRRQLKAAEPLLDLRLFRAPAFSVSLGAYLLATFALFGAFVFLSQYLQLVFGLTPVAAGAWLMPWALAFVVGTLATSVLARRVEPATLMAGGLVVAAAGFGLLTQVHVASGPLALAVASVVVALGLSPVFTLSTDAVIGSAPVERAGAVAAISETSSEFGGALGIAILGSLGSAVYRGHMAEVLPPTLRPDLAEAARGTLAGAVAVAEQMPSSLGSDLLVAARDAFAQTFELTAGLTAAVALIAAALVAILLRKSSEHVAIEPTSIQSGLTSRSSRTRVPRKSDSPRLAVHRAGGVFPSGR